MTRLFQVDPIACESALTLDDKRSLFECVLWECYHHDVRTISAMLLERIAERGGGLPPESLCSLASWIEELLASATQCTPRRGSNRGPEGPSPSAPLTRAPRLGQVACRSAWCPCSSRPPRCTHGASMRCRRCRWTHPSPNPDPYPDPAPAPSPGAAEQVRRDAGGRRRRLQAGADRPAVDARRLQPAHRGGTSNPNLVASSSNQPWYKRACASRWAVARLLVRASAAGGLRRGAAA